MGMPKSVDILTITSKSKGFITPSSILNCLSHGVNNLNIIPYSQVSKIRRIRLNYHSLSKHDNAFRRISTTKVLLQQTFQSHPLGNTYDLSISYVLILEI